MHAIFFVGRLPVVTSRTKRMGKVVLFAVLTLDGCLADKPGEVRREIEEIRETAHPLSENTPLTLLSGWVKESPSHCVHLIEAATETADTINILLRMRRIDEIIFCTLPVISGKSNRLFRLPLPESLWALEETKVRKGGYVRTVYRRHDPEN